MGKKNWTISRNEAQVAKIVYDLQEATVQQVLDALPPEREITYATVQTMLRRLEKKGVLTHTQKGRAHVFKMVLKKEDLVERMVNSVLRSLFGGKADISMDVHSLPDIGPGLEEANIKIGLSGLDLFKIIKSGKPLERNDSSIKLNVGQSGGVISGPSVILTSKSGKTRAVLGRVELEVTATGETRERPESSLVFFDKDGKCMWSAP